MNAPVVDPGSVPEGARRVKPAWGGFLALLAVSVLAEFGVSLHPHFELEALPGFHAAYALLVGAVTIAIARIVGTLLRRAQGYYGADDE